MTTETPHVYTALAAILKSLSVEKNGQLPGNPTRCNVVY